MYSVPSIPVCVSVIKDVNGALQFRLALVCITQDIVLAPNIINILGVEGVVETLPVALRMDVEVAG